MRGRTPTGVPCSRCGCVVGVVMCDDDPLAHPKLPGQRLHFFDVGLLASSPDLKPRLVREVGHPPDGGIDALLTINPPDVKKPPIPVSERKPLS